MPQASNRAAAIVTGASSGIGAAIARELARSGVSTVLGGRDEGALGAVAAECRRTAPAVVVAGDVTDPASLDALVRAADGLGGLDLLVNNAGVSMNARFEDLEPAVLRHVLEVDFFAPAELTRRCLPMLRARRGRIVMMSSLLGLVGTPTRSAYAAAKHAVHGLSQSLRIELRADGVSVTVVCPGYVDTPIRARALLGDGRRQGHDDVAGRRMLTPEEVARATLRAAARRRRLILLGRETRLARALSLLAPGLLESVLARAGR